MQDMVYKIKADFLKILGHPVRLKLIEELKSGEKASGIWWLSSRSDNRAFPPSLGLRNTGILSSRQEKTTVFYDIADHDIFHVLRPSR